MQNYMSNSNGIFRASVVISLHIPNTIYVIIMINFIHIIKKVHKLNDVMI